MTLVPFTVSVFDDAVSTCWPLPPPRLRAATVVLTSSVTENAAFSVMSATSVLVGGEPVLQFAPTLQLPPDALIHDTVGGPAAVIWKSAVWTDVNPGDDAVRA